MCGRFLLNSEIEEVVERFGVEQESDISYHGSEIYPANSVPVILFNDKRQIEILKWGFPFHGGSRTIINAKSETVDEKPMFRRSFLERRCIIPANAFYEWKQDSDKKIRYRIEIKDQRIFSLAGIYNSFLDSNNNRYNAFTILTTEANTVLKDIHERMPVIITPENEDLWLRSRNADIEYIRTLMSPLDNKYVNLIKDEKNYMEFEQLRIFS